MRAALRERRPGAGEARRPAPPGDRLHGHDGAVHGALPRRGGHQRVRRGGAHRAAGRVRREDTVPRAARKVKGEK